MAERFIGELTETGCTLAEMQAIDGKPRVDIPQDRRVLLKLPTFESASRLAARSRMLGGYHISTDNDVGHAYGQRLADYCWKRYQSYFDGTARGGD